MEVVVERENGLRGRGGRHRDRLQALVVTEAVGDSAKAASVAADKASDANRPIDCTLRIRDVVGGILNLGQLLRSVIGVCDYAATRVCGLTDRAVEIVAIRNGLVDAADGSLFVPHTPHSVIRPGGRAGAISHSSAAPDTEVAGAAAGSVVHECVIGITNAAVTVGIRFAGQAI